jgi:hypothetical protein
MKSLLLAVAVVLSSSAAFAQNTEKFHGANPARPGGNQQGPQGPQGHQGPSTPPSRNQVVLERQELNDRLTRLERMLEEAYDRAEQGKGRGKVGRALEELTELRRLVANAPSGYQPPQPLPPPPPPVVQPIADGRLRRLTEAMAREAFSREKLTVLREAAAHDNFLIGQTRGLLEQFTFSNDRLEAVRILWPRVLDRNNSFQLYEAFVHSSDKQKLRQIIGG